MLNLTTRQINVIPFPKRNTIVFNLDLGYRFIYNGEKWIMFNKPRVKWFVKREDSLHNIMINKWMEDCSISPKYNTFKECSDKIHYNYFYNLKK